MEQTDEARLVFESSVEAQIAAVITPIVIDLSMFLVEVRFTHDRERILQIMIENGDGLANIDDCAQVSRAIAPVLDAEDLVKGAYNLVVSSPGIDRPLVRRRDFERWKNYRVRVKLKEPLQERMSLRGQLSDISDKCFVLKLQEAEGRVDDAILIPFAQAARVQLVMDDDLIAAAGAKTEAPSS